MNTASTPPSADAPTDGNGNGNRKRRVCFSPAVPNAKRREVAINSGTDGRDDRLPVLSSSAASSPAAAASSPAAAVSSPAAAVSTNATVSASALPPRKVQSRTPKPIPPLDDIPPINRKIIEGAIGDVFKIDTPRPFQTEAVNYSAFYDDSFLYMIRKTADGKSLVPLTVAAIRRGVNVVLVPLIGLGSDQVEKASIPGQNYEAYHFDEHKYNDAKALRSRILGMDKAEAENVTIVGFLSPQALTSSSSWFLMLKKLASRGLISSITIESPHCRNEWEGFSSRIYSSLSEY